MKEKLELRKKLKAKKPDFIRQDAHKKGEISFNWRRPKGLQSKMRLHRKGYCRSVSTGWKSPAEVKGMHESGLIIKNVHNVKELSTIDKDKDGIIIAGTVGIRKKVEIVKKAKEANIKILNLSDSDAFIKEIEEKLKQNKENKKSKTAKKTEKKKEAKPKKEEKKEELTDEEKQKKDKAEKDKVLRTKQ